MLNEQYVDENSQAQGNSKLKYIKFIFAMTLFAILFFVRDVFFIPVPNYILVIASAIMFLFFNVNESVAFAISLVVFGCGMQVNYALGIGLIIICLKKGKNLTFSRYFFPIAALLIWELFHALVQPFDFVEYARTFINFVLLAVIVCDKDVKYDNKLVMNTFILATIVVFLDIIMQTINYYGSINEFIAAGLRLGDVNSLAPQNSELYSLSYNQNFLGLLSAYSIACIFTLYNYNNKFLNRIILLIELCLLTLFGLLTVSRTFVVVLVLIGVFGIIAIRLYSKKRIGIAMLTAIIIMIVTYFIMQLIVPEILTSITTRFTQEEISGSRIELFGTYSRYIFSNPMVIFFGIGLQSILIKITNLGFNNSYLDLVTVPHNATIEILLCWGILGLALLVLLIVIIIKNAKGSKGEKIPLINYVVIVALLVSIQAGQFVRMHEKVLLLALAFCALQYGDNNRNSGGEIWRKK